MLHIRLDLLILELSSNQPLESKHRILRINHSLTLRRQSDKSFSMFGERYNGWRCSVSLGVFDHSSSLALHDGNAGVGCAQVYANYWAYLRYLNLCTKKKARR